MLTQYLGYAIRWPVFQRHTGQGIVLGKDVQPGLGAPGPAGPLQAVGLGYLGDEQTLYAIADFRTPLHPRVDDDIDVVDGDTGRGDVGGEDNFALRVVAEGPLLLLWFQLAVQRNDRYLPQRSFDGDGF